MSVIEILEREYGEIRSHEYDVMDLYAIHVSKHDHISAQKSVDVYTHLVHERQCVRDAIELLRSHGYK